MTPTADRPTFMSGGASRPEPKLFALDNAGRPVPVRLGAGLRLDVDLATADYVLNALAPIPPPRATVCGSRAEFMADTDTFLVPQPVETARPKGLSGFALYRNGIRQRVGVDFAHDPADPFRIMPLDLGSEVRWDGSDYVLVDFVATY